MNTLANLFAYYNNGEQDVYHFVLEKILVNTELLLCLNCHYQSAFSETGLQKFF